MSLFQFSNKKKKKLTQPLTPKILYTLIWLAPAMFWKPAAFTDPKIQYDRNYLLLSWQSDNFWTVWSQLQSFLWNREHQRQFLEYYVYFIVLQPVTCDMKPRKITDKPLQGSVMTWYEATTWPFLLQESVFLLYLSGKKLHKTITLWEDQH